MENTVQGQPRRNTVTLVRWSKKPGEDPFIKFVLFSILGLILCLISMIFMPFLRNFGAVALFTVILPAILTVPVVSSQRSFMQGLTRTVNDTIVEVTGTRKVQLSVRRFRQLVKSGEQLPAPRQRRARAESACGTCRNAGEKCPREMACGLYRNPS